MNSLQKLTTFISFFILITGSNFAQWTRTSGPYGAFITSVATQDGYVIAGSHSGVYRKPFESSEWTTGNETLFGYFIIDLISSFGNVYAATNHGIFISSNAGLDWSLAALANEVVFDLIVKDTLIYAGTWTDVLVSSDHGLTWSASGNVPWDYGAVELASNLDLLLAAVNGRGLYKSYDNGNTWIKTNLEPRLEVVACYGEEILAAGSGTNHVYISTDYGDTWIIKNLGGSAGTIKFTTDGSVIWAGTNYGIYRSTTSGYSWEYSGLEGVFVSEVWRDNSLLIAGTNQGAYVSPDTGRTWFEENEGLISGDATCLAVSGNIIFAGTDGFGVFRSTDHGLSWIPFNNGLLNRQVTGLSINEDNIYIGTYNGMYRANISEDLWTKISSFALSSSFIFSSDTIFASAGYGIVRSEDNGNSWFLVDSLWQPWDILKVGTTIIAGYNQRGIRISTDGGNTWEYSNNGLPEMTINSLAFAKGKVIAGSAGAGIYLSEDTAKTWYQSQLDSTQIWDLYTYNDFVFGASGRGVCISDDGGVNWKWKSEGLEDYFVFSLVAEDGYLYAGVRNGAVWRRPFQQVVGISPHESSVEPDFRLSQNYPNPFNPSTTINFRIKEKGFVSLKVYDILGNEVAELVGREKPAGQYSVQFDGSKLSSGIYFYHITAGSFTQTKKMIIIR